jgi:uncharacterized protein (DUF305 family)
MTKNLIIAVLALLSVILGFLAFNYYIYYEKQGGMDSAMHEMTGSLDGLEGDALDEAFLESMIVHHEGAVEMAERILEGSSREELRTLAATIIEAQTKEIEQMRTWQTEWFTPHAH